MASEFVCLEGAQGLLTLMLTPQQSALIQEGNYRQKIIKMLDMMSTNGELTKHYDNAQKYAWDCIPPPNRANRVKQHHHTAVKLLEIYDNDSKISHFLLKFVKKCSNQSCSGNVFLKFMELVVVDLHRQLCQNQRIYESVYSSLAPNSDVIDLTELQLSSLSSKHTDEDSAPATSLTTPRSSTSSTQLDAANPEEDNADDLHFHWNHASTMFLLNLFLDKKDDLKKVGSSRTSFWRIIGATMNSSGFRVTGYMCDRKIRNMQTTYRRIRDKLRISGSGGPPRWPYYDLLQQIMDSDPAVDPISTVSSLQSVPMTSTATPSTSDTSVTTPTSQPGRTASKSVTTDKETPKRKRMRTSSTPTSSQSDPPDWYIQVVREERQHSDEQFERMAALQERTLQLQQERNIILKDLSDALKNFNK